MGSLSKYYRFGRSIEFKVEKVLFIVLYFKIIKIFVCFFLRRVFFSIVVCYVFGIIELV